MNELRPRATLATLAAAALLALAAGCASLQPDQPGTSAVAGHWLLDVAASGDFDAAVTRMLAEHQKKMRARGRRREEYGADGSEISPRGQDVPGFPPVPDEAPERVRTRLAEALRPPARLVIKLDPDSVSLTADGEPARVFYPGQRVGRIDTGGTARLDAGWSGAAFVVQQKYDGGARRVQRYAAQGDELVVTLAYTDPYSGSFDLRSVYRRQPAAP